MIPRTSRKHSFRSGLEARIAGDLEDNGIEYEFENLRIKYVKPQKYATYTPDFVLPNGIIIEAKGRFLTADRQKHLLIKAQFPEHDIRFVFSNPASKIGKGSKTSYADWCEKKGYLYSQELIPLSWIKEPPKASTSPRNHAPAADQRTT